MTFVAQPYQQFVEDLVTGLTGGLTREEHQFLVNEESYTLAAPDVNKRTITVFGQSNRAFVKFEPGIDYEYQPEEGAIYWKSQGKQPDDRSFFYINYYLQQGYSRLSDRNPGSVISILSEAFGREFAVLHQEMELIYRSGFVDLAEGASLDHVAALLGLTRKDARFAGGEVLFKRGTPAEGDITIATGTLVSTNQGQNFETTDKRTLRKGQLSVVCPIRAQAEGPAGQVEAGAITIVNRPIFGIEAVLNEKPSFFATAKETDEEFRRRIKGALERAGKASLNAIKYSLIEEIPEVKEGSLQVTEKPEVPGMVEVKFGWEPGGDADLVRRIEESIFNSRAAGVRVVHNLSTRTKSPAAQRAEARQPTIPTEETTPAPEAQTQPEKKRKKQQVVHLPAEVLEKMPEGIMPMRVEVFLSLAEANLSASQKESIQDQVREIILDYIEALPMGNPVIYNKLLGRIIQADDILDADVMLGTKQGIGNLQYRANLATDGRKARIDDPLRDVFVALMEEVVFISLTVLIEPKKNLVSTEGKQTLQPGVEEIEPKNDMISAEVKQTLQQGVEDIINDGLMGSNRKLSKPVLKEKIAQYITQNDLPVQLKEGDPLVLDVEFEETGRVLKHTDEVLWEDYHTPQLQDLTIKEQGVLDG
ncbi:MAG: baseplate J/gp47 family protein [Candidatus Aminicenantes bacterium]|jgi:uncharacterized phage protein gp47/JayE